MSNCLPYPLPEVWQGGSMGNYRHGWENKRLNVKGTPLIVFGEAPPLSYGPWGPKTLLFADTLVGQKVVKC